MPFSHATKLGIYERDAACVRCGAPALGHGRHAHHRWLAGQGGPDIPSNGVRLGFACHEWAHSRRRLAEAAGWILRRTPRLVPAEVAFWSQPVQAWILAADDFTWAYWDRQPPPPEGALAA